MSLILSFKLDAIHDHLNNSAMERITWIVIWCAFFLFALVLPLLLHNSLLTLVCLFVFSLLVPAG